MSKSLLFWIFLALVAAAVIIYVAVGMKGDESDDVGEIPDGESVVCTMEVKLCPDGSEVGRRPPTCDFAPCPGGERDPS